MRNSLEKDKLQFIIFNVANFLFVQKLKNFNFNN